MVEGWLMAGGTVHELRPKASSESEKITINLGHVDLGHIDLLVRDGFYANRTDFIRTAIRNQVERHAEAARHSVSRRNLDLGLRHYSREELETAHAAQRPRDVGGTGLGGIAPSHHPLPPRVTHPLSRFVGPCRPAPGARPRWPTGQSE